MNTERVVPMPRAVVAIAVAGLGLAAVPLIALATRAPWSAMPHILTRETGTRALGVSLVVSVVAAAVCLVVGLPLAMLLARGRFPGRSLVRALVLLPLVAPPVVGGVALLAAFGRRGTIGKLLEPLGISLPFTMAGAILAAAFVALPLAVITMESALRAHGTRLEQAAAALGASPWLTLRAVTLPALRPAIAAGTMLAWARALGEFGATITFAGNISGRTQTLPLAVYETLQTDPDAAIMLSVVLLAVSLATLIGLRGRLLER